jgi:hypothetical protein
MTGYILLGVVVLLLVGAVTIYNRLVTNKNMVAEGWSGIDVQLKRRASSPLDFKGWASPAPCGAVREKRKSKSTGQKFRGVNSPKVRTS